MSRLQQTLLNALGVTILVSLLQLTASSAAHAQAGNFWRPVDGLRGGFVGNLSLSPSFAADRTLYAAAGRSGVYRSNDGGASWTVVGAGQLCGS